MAVRRDRHITGRRCLNSFHLHNLKHILNIKWQQWVTNTCPSPSQPPSLQTLLYLQRLRWLGHVKRRPDGHITKDILYGEVPRGRQFIKHPKLHFSDVVKRDLTTYEISPTEWEAITRDRHLETRSRVMQTWVKPNLSRVLKPSMLEGETRHQTLPHPRMARSVFGRKCKVNYDQLGNFWTNLVIFGLTQ